jgi:peptide/nickel transport system substrate-binding protein
MAGLQDGIHPFLGVERHGMRRSSRSVGSNRYSGLVLLASAIFAFGATAAIAEAPKRGGVLTYMIPADGGPSLDGHRETTYAVVHATAPFYSVLIRVNPDNPASTTDFRCDLCTDMPTPTDNGLTYTFKIRKGVKFHDGSPLTAQDVAASWNKIVRARTTS